MPRYENLWARLVANTHEPENAQACWTWAGRLDREGYGLINMWVPGLGRNATLKSHVLLWVWLNVPEARTADDLFLAYKELTASGLELDHLCTDRWCCNPDHLDLVTASENNIRRVNRARRGVFAAACGLACATVCTPSTPTPEP